MLKNIFYGWWIVLSCFLIGFLVASIAVFGFPAFIEPLREEFGWSYTQISFAGSMRIFVSGIFGMMMGALIDRFGSRKIILFGTISPVYVRINRSPIARCSHGWDTVHRKCWICITIFRIRTAIRR